jgi:hypothetical protein
VNEWGGDGLFPYIEKNGFGTDRHSLTTKILQNNKNTERQRRLLLEISHLHFDLESGRWKRFEEMYMQNPVFQLVGTNQNIDVLAEEQFCYMRVNLNQMEIWARHSAIESFVARKLFFEQMAESIFIQEESEVLAELDRDVVSRWLFIF